MSSAAEGKKNREISIQLAARKRKLMTRLSLALRVVVLIFIFGASPVFAGYQFVDLSPVNYSPSSARE